MSVCLSKTQWPEPQRHQRNASLSLHSEIQCLGHLINRLISLTCTYPTYVCVRWRPSEVRVQLSENGVILEQSLETFESSTLSTDTSVRLISTDSHGTSARAIMCRWESLWPYFALAITDNVLNATNLKLHLKVLSASIVSKMTSLRVVY